MAKAPPATPRKAAPAHPKTPQPALLFMRGVRWTIPLSGRSAPYQTEKTRRPCDRRAYLDVRLLGHDEGVVHLDAQIAHGALKLRVAEQQLARAQIARSFVDERNLRPPKAVCPVARRIETDQRNPFIDEPAVLPRCQVIAWAAAARLQPITRSQPA